VGRVVVEGRDILGEKGLPPTTKHCGGRESAKSLNLNTVKRKKKKNEKASNPFSSIYSKGHVREKRDYMSGRYPVGHSNQRRKGNSASEYAARQGRAFLKLPALKRHEP